MTQPAVEAAAPLSWPGAAPLRWRAQRLELLPERALWVPEEHLLLVADLHLGKAEAFQASGVPLPSDGDLTTLNRLLSLAHGLRPQRVVVLGDLIHSRAGLTGDLRQKLAALPALLGCPLQLVGGNHDAGSWLEGLPAEPAQASGALWLSHEPQPTPAPELLNVCGHLHPVTVLGRGADRLRLPCFALDASQARLQLPAFGALTGGHPCDPALERWVIAGGKVLAVP
ncbi:MAG: ligase-associated DNA damage response endonuclease PdeM [Cyanobium sp.]